MLSFTLSLTLTMLSNKLTLFYHYEQKVGDLIN